MIKLLTTAAMVAAFATPSFAGSFNDAVVAPVQDVFVEPSSSNLILPVVACVILCTAVVAALVDNDDDAAVATTTVVAD